MKIGIVELRNYQFMQDVASRLGDIGVEYISTAEHDYQGETRYRVIVDRLSFQDPYLRQLMMLHSINGTYVFNNPFACSINNKMLGQRLLGPLGIKQPRTIVLPRVNDEWDLGGSVREPDWDKIRKEMNFPCIMKPFDGFAWENVYSIGSFRELQNLYNALKRKHIMLAQEKVEYEDYFRVFCIGKKDVLICKWVPKPFGMGVCEKPDQKKFEKFGAQLAELTIKMNKALDFDFNAVEWCIDSDGELCMIDGMNEVPDINKGTMPEDNYWWLVDRFAACVREKFNSQETNRTTFCGNV